MDQVQLRFLLDENVPHKLKDCFIKKGFNITTLKSEGWKGYKNGELAQVVFEKQFVLVTRDRDFTFLWKKYKLRVLYLAIHPSTLDHLQPRVEELLSNWTYKSEESFLIIVQNDSIRVWQKDKDTTK